MEKIESGKYVELVYDLYVVKAKDDEELVHQVDPADPEKIVFGVTPGVIEPLAAAIEGLGQGDSFDVYVDSADAFGPRDPERVAHLEKEIFEIDGKFDSRVKVGALLPMQTAEGFQMVGLVAEITDKEVAMDFNHPLAGKNIHFKGHVQTVRDATPEEIRPAGGCGSCGCSGNCDDNDGACGCSGCGN